MIVNFICVKFIIRLFWYLDCTCEYIEGVSSRTATRPSYKNFQLSVADGISMSMQLSPVVERPNTGCAVAI